MLFNIIYARITISIILATTSLAVAGCNIPTTQPPLAVEISAVAPHEISLPVAGDVMTLPMSVQLHNHGAQTIDLFTGTRCAVFRWMVVNAHGDTVQKQPNRICAQATVRDVLLPGKQQRQRYEILLDAKRYTAGNRYRLRYQFWNYVGIHNFTVTNTEN